ncbi:hypothetical protein ACFQO9_17255 [Chryseobacterium zhengzhouense]|uniref:Uncharacterized protein n=1 Tax=Chryseobacterium zhengzhouense TaxID=1636086 RepID=A0ABW2M4M2_9FLAO
MRDLVKDGKTPKQAAELVAKQMRDKIAEDPTRIINEIFKPKL